MALVLTVLERIWEGILDHVRQGMPQPPPSQSIPHLPEVAYQILDNFNDLQLVNFMRACPELSGFIFFYGMRYRWTDAGYHPHIGADAVQWHQYRHHYLQRKNQLQGLRAQIQQTQDQGYRRQLQQDWKRIRLHQLQPLEVHLRNTQQQVQRNLNQAPELTRVAVADRTPTQQWYLNCRIAITNYLADQIQVTQNEIQQIQQDHPRLAPVAPVPALAVPVPNNDINTNLLGIFDPIEQLVQLDALEVLVMLKRLGVFDPFGYTRLGYSYLMVAINYDKDRVARWLMRQYTRGDMLRVAAVDDLLFLVPLDNMNHLDLLVQKDWHRTFHDWWNRVQPVNAGAVLNACTQEVLCTFVDRAFALSLEPLGLVLGWITVNLVNHRIPSHAGGTPWHLAVRNPNLDFMDYLRIRCLARISDDDDDDCNPLTCAILEQNSFGHAQLLVQYGCLRNQAALYVLEGLPDFNDNWVQLLWNGNSKLNPGAQSPEGTWLHLVVKGLDHEFQRVQRDVRLLPNEKRNQKNRLVTRALKLIKMIRRGNGVSTPNLNTLAVDQNGQNGRTAQQLAQDLGLFRIVYALRANTNPTGRRRHGHGYYLR